MITHNHRQPHPRQTLMDDERVVGSWTSHSVAIDMQDARAAGRDREVNRVGAFSNVATNITLTDRRLLAHVPAWKKGLGVKLRVVMAVVDDDDDDEIYMAGHMPLTSVSRVSHDSQGKVSIHHLYGEGDDLMFFGVHLSLHPEHAESLAQSLIAVIRQRWSTQPMPDAFGRALRDVRATHTERRAVLRKSHEQTSTLPFYRAATTGAVLVRNSGVTPDPDRLGTSPLL